MITIHSFSHSTGRVYDRARGVFDNTQHLDSSDSRRMKTNLELKLQQICQTKKTDVQVADLTNPSQICICVIN